MPMPNRTVVIAFSSLSAIGLLTGCSAAGAAPPADGTTSDAPTATYADGTYTADGKYLAPSGPETITVSVTLASGAVTAVDVTGHASDPQAKRHQADFIGGIATAVVGRPIDGLAVDRVAGSSLTGQGFNAALDTIRAEADA